MAGLKNRNNDTGGILLYTLVIDGEKINKDYLLKILKSKKIDSVRGMKVGGKYEEHNVEEWLNRKWDGVERNYIYLLFAITVFCNFRWAVRATKNDEVQYEEFVNIPANSWREYIPHRLLPVIKSILQKAEVLEWNDRYLSAPASIRSARMPFTKSVRIFNESSRGVTTVSLPKINTRKVIKDNSIWLKREIKPIKDHLEVTEAIEQNILKLRIADDAVTVAENFDYSKNPDTKDPAKAKASAVSTISKIHAFAAISKTPKQRENWQLYLSYYEHTGRCYHNLSNLKKDFRSLLSIKGAPIWQVDMKSCHPYLLIKLYEKSAAHKVILDREKRLYKKRFSHNSDFYTTVGNLGGIPKENANQSDVEYRAMIKELFWQFLYGKPKAPKDCLFTKAFVELGFKELLKTIHNLKTSWWIDEKSAAFDKIKRDWIDDNNSRKRKGWPERPFDDFQYKQLANYQSRLEGRIILKGVCKQLVNKGVFIDGKQRQPWFVPLHDAIWCQQYAVKPIKRLIKEVWEKETGFPAYVTAKEFV